MEQNSLKSLVIPDEGRDDVQKLLSLSAEDLAKLEETLTDRSALKDDRRPYRRVAQALEISPQAAISVLTAVGNIRSQRERFNISDTDLFADLEVLGTVDDATREGLRSLLCGPDDGYFVEKVGSLRHAIAPHATDVRTVVDARPVFSQDRARVDALVLLTYLELGVHDPRDGRNDTLVVQLSRTQVAKLREVLEDAEKKLDKLAETFGAHEIYE
ncbi:MAG: hypothetical protein H6716_17225 [Polyangiaceae bacterium]|nr:hypothetical protein [Polyangiaceae bacterium]